jgi:hypothetical protein
VDRAKVLSNGREVAGKLLVELQVRKSTADGAGAREFYTKLTDPLPHWEGDIRELVLKKKQVCNVKITVACGKMIFMHSREKFLCNQTPSSLMAKCDSRNIRSPQLVQLRVSLNDDFDS